MRTHESPAPDPVAATDAISRINQRASELAVRDRPPALDRSFGGSILPALQEIAYTTLIELEELGKQYRAGVRSMLKAIGRQSVATVTAEAEYSDRLQEAAQAEEAQGAARGRLLLVHPEREFSGRSKKPLTVGIFLFAGGLAEGLLAAPVGTAMGLPGNEILMTQAVLAIVLSLGAVLGGWLAAQANLGAWPQRIVAGLGASALIAALLVVQSKLAPIRGDIVAGNINSILKDAGNGHITVTTISPQLAKELFLALGRLIVSLGAIEGYILHDPVTPGYQRATKKLERTRTAVRKMRHTASVQNISDALNSASFHEYRASWADQARKLQAAGEAAMSRYLGEVAACSDPDTRAALIEARRPTVPLPGWVTSHSPVVSVPAPSANGHHSLSPTS